MKADVDEPGSGASLNPRPGDDVSILYLENDRRGGTKALFFYSTFLALSLYLLPREPLLVFAL